MFDDEADEPKMRYPSGERVFAPDDKHNFTGFFMGIDLSMFKNKIPVRA